MNTNANPSLATPEEIAAYKLQNRRASAAARKAERDRARALNAPEPPRDGPDLGPAGEAFAARPYAMTDQGAVSRGSVQTGRVIEAKRMTDTCLIDRMSHAAQLSDRQHKAAKMLLMMYHSGGIGRRVTANLGYVSDYDGEPPDDTEPGATSITLEPGETWADRLRQILRGFGSHQADILMGLLQDRHPGCRFLATAQACLDRVAEDLGYKVDLVGMRSEGSGSDPLPK